MFNYLLVALSVVGLALQFSAVKLFQLKFGTALRTSLSFTALTGITAAVIFFCIGGFSLEITPFSAAAAAAVAILCCAYSLIGIRIISLGSVSVYTMFLMLGGMLLPYFYGLIFLDEKITVFRVVGIALLTVSLMIPCTSKNIKIEKPRVFFSLCFIVFVLNGFVSIVSKAHQVETLYETCGTVSFVIMSNLFNGILSAAAFAVISLGSGKKADTASAGGKSPLWQIPCIAAASALLGGVSYLFQLKGAVSVPATVLYPMVTGGSVALTAAAARLFYKEKPDRPSFYAIVLSFAATFLFLF